MTIFDVPAAVILHSRQLQLSLQPESYQHTISACYLKQQQSSRLVCSDSNVSKKDDLQGYVPRGSAIHVPPRNLAAVPVTPQQTQAAKVGLGDIEVVCVGLAPEVAVCARVHCVAIDGLP